jgi:ribonucleoside-diphosphate reductase alpha subunit
MTVLIELIRELAVGGEHNLNVDVSLVEQKIKNIRHSEPFTDTDYDLAIEACSDKYYEDVDWLLLAGRLFTHKLKQTTPKKFSTAMQAIKASLDPKFLNFVIENADALDKLVIPDRDYKFDIFGIKTLAASYLSKIRDGDKVTIYETPQYMYLRMAAYMWFPNMSRIRKMYTELSEWQYSHATPTMFNAGMKRPALSSCFKMTTQDTLDDIALKWKYEGIISKNAGGIGKDFSHIRHSEIGANGRSNGVVPWLKIDNEILSAVDQGGKRKGSMAAYLKVWHVDVFDFIDAANPNKKNSAPDLFYGLMVPDLFMKRVQEDGMWSLFCPAKQPILTRTWGEEFEQAYLHLERSKLFVKQVRAVELMNHIIASQQITGKPYMCYIDSMNRKCNQTHNGNMVDISNLCTEITGISNSEEIFSCNLASVCLNSCIEPPSGDVSSGDGKTPSGVYFDFEKLKEITRSLVRNLDQSIDRNFYHAEIPEIRRGNFRRRPLGIGVQGLADTFAMLGLPWTTPDGREADPKTREFHKKIFEVMYLAGVRESIELAKEEGMYPTFPGSPASFGLFQFDLWQIEKLGVTREEYTSPEFTSRRYQPSSITKDELEKLRSDMIRFGLRNSLIFSLMPTASSAHILGNNECFEPFNNIIGKRKVLSGEYTLINKYFMRDAKRLKLWNTETFEQIVRSKGTLEGWNPTFSETSKYKNAEDFTHDVNKLKLKYKCIYDISQRVLVDYCADRSWFVCQSQSMNCHMKDPDYKKIFAYHMYTWKQGLKTGMYYLRQPPLKNAIDFASGSIRIGAKKKDVVCDEEVCTSCAL